MELNSSISILLLSMTWFDCFTLFIDFSYNTHPKTAIWASENCDSCYSWCFKVCVLRGRWWRQRHWGVIPQSNCPCRINTSCLQKVGPWYSRTHHLVFLGLIWLIFTSQEQKDKKKLCALLGLFVLQLMVSVPETQCKI